MNKTESQCSKAKIDVKHLAPVSSLAARSEQLGDKIKHLSYFLQLFLVTWVIVQGQNFCFLQQLYFLHLHQVFLLGCVLHIFRVLLCFSGVLCTSLCLGVFSRFLYLSSSAHVFGFLSLWWTFVVFSMFLCSVGISKCYAWVVQLVKMWLVLCLTVCVLLNYSALSSQHYLDTYHQRYVEHLNKVGNFRFKGMIMLLERVISDW